MAESAIPPSPNFSTIDFNPSFFSSTSGDYVDYPEAQGTVTFGSIYATDIDTPTPAVDFDLLSTQTGNLNFGTSIASTKTLAIGSSAGITNINGIGTIKANAFDAVSATGNDVTLFSTISTKNITIGAGQTTGVLNLGTGSRITGSNGGGINIGTLATGTIPITIGTTGKTTTTLNGTNITATTKLSTPVLDSSGISTNMTIGANLTSGNLTLGGGSGHTGTINIGSGQTSGALNIGNGARTSTATINIGTQVSAFQNMGILIGTPTYSYTTLYGYNVGVETKLTTPILDAKAYDTAMTIGSNLTSGTLTIGGTGQQGAINIDTTSTGAHNITIGTAGSTTTVLRGLSVDVGTKLTTPKLDADAISSAMTIGSNLTSGSLTIGGTLGHTGDISLGAGQTTGDLYIGTGARTSASDIRIGTGANGAGTIYIGHTGTTISTQLVKINTSTGVGAGATTIGSSTSGTTINGALTVEGTLTANNGIVLPTGDTISGAGAISTSGNISTSGSISTTSGTMTSAGLLTATGGLTLGSGKGITCGGAVYSPALTNTQIGWSTVIQNSAQVNLTSTSQTILTSSNTLPIGVYLIAVNMNIQTWSPANLTNYLTMTWTNTTGCSVNIVPLACAGTNTLTSCTFSGVLTVTSATNTITLGGATNVSGYTCVIPFVSSLGYAQMSVCRIA